MSLSWFVPSVVIGRGIGIVAITFGISAIPFDKFTTVWHWVIFVALCLAATAGVLYLANLLNKIMEKKRNATK